MALQLCCELSNNGRSLVKIAPAPVRERIPRRPYRRLHLRLLRLPPMPDRFASRRIEGTKFSPESSDPIRTEQVALLFRWSHFPSAVRHSFPAFPLSAPVAGEAPKAGRSAENAMFSPSFT